MNFFPVTALFVTAIFLPLVAGECSASPVQSAGQLAGGNKAVETKAVGTKALDFRLKAVAGELEGDVVLSEITKEHPVVILQLKGFIGKQCPVCSRQVGEFISSAEKFKALGAKVFLIYPGRDETTAARADEFLEDTELPAPMSLLIDPKLKFATDYGLDGDTPGINAHPATLVIGTDGLIKFIESGDGKERSNPKDVLAVLASTGTNTVVSAPQSQYEQLFDGKSLKGWHILQVPEDHKLHATTKNFFAKDGAIHCCQSPNRRGGVLMTDRKFRDFVLEMEFKNDWGNDSGIFLHCNDAGEGIQILNDYLDNGCIGFPFGQGTGGFISSPFVFREEAGVIKAVDSYDAIEKDKLIHAIDADRWNEIWKADDWNSIKIRCVGSAPKITTWINGTKIMEMDGATYAARGLKNLRQQKWDTESAWDSKRVNEITGGEGAIAVQIHRGRRWKEGGATLYRNIRIKELNK